MYNRVEFSILRIQLWMELLKIEIRTRMEVYLQILCICNYKFEITYSRKILLTFSSNCQAVIYLILLLAII